MLKFQEYALNIPIAFNKDTTIDFGIVDGGYTDNDGIGMSIHHFQRNKSTKDKATPLLVILSTIDYDNIAFIKEFHRQYFADTDSVSLSGHQLLQFPRVVRKPILMNFVHQTLSYLKWN